jgi:hypothetical protein
MYQKTSGVGNFASQGNLPRPKNMPLACFFNGLSIPVGQKITPPK